MLQTNPSSAAVDACLGEDEPKSLARCIRLNLDCADMCDATGRIFSCQTAFEPQMARAALQACAEACRHCQQACNNVLSEAGVRASCATLSTVEAGLYALNERPGVHGSGARVGLQHLLGVGHEAAFLSGTSI